MGLPRPNPGATFENWDVLDTIVILALERWYYCYYENTEGGVAWVAVTGVNIYSTVILVDSSGYTDASATDNNLHNFCHDRCCRFCVVK